MPQVQTVKVRNLTRHPIRVGEYYIPPTDDPRTQGWGDMPVNIARQRLLNGDSRLHVPPEVMDMPDVVHTGPPSPPAGPAVPKPEKPAEIPLPTLPCNICPVPADFQGSYFVVLSGVPWGGNGQGQTPTELSKALARAGHRVLYIHMSDPSLDAEYEKVPGVDVFAMAKAFSVQTTRAHFLDIKKRIETNKSSLARVRALVRAWAGPNAGERAYTIVTVPLPGYGAIAHELKLLDKFKTVYMCFDPWAEFGESGEFHSYDPVERGGQVFTREEIKLFDEDASHVVCTASALLDFVKTGLSIRHERDGEDSVPVAMIPNGFVEEHFPTGLTATVPADMCIGNPTVVYWGHLAGSWFDWPMLARAARQLPHAQFNIIGNKPNNKTWERLGFNPRSLPRNVHFLGRREHTQLWEYGQHADVAIIPFKEGRLTECVCPIKAFEYLACGLPVVSTGVSETNGMPGTFLADAPKGDETEFVKAIQVAFRNREKFPKKRVAKVLAEATWSQRAASFLKHIGVRVSV